MLGQVEEALNEKLALESASVNAVLEASIQVQSSQMHIAAPVRPQENALRSPCMCVVSQSAS